MTHPDHPTDDHLTGFEAALASLEPAPAERKGVTGMSAHGVFVGACHPIALAKQHDIAWWITG